MTSHVISDLPTLNDRLQRETIVRGISHQIASCDAPHTIGVHGDWGSGKTSLLRQVRYHLTGETEGADKPLDCGLQQSQYKEQVVTVWFEAWRYQNEPTPIVALLAEMRRQFGFLAKVKFKGEKLTSVAFRSLLNSLAQVAGRLIGSEALPIHPDKIEAVGRRWEREHLEVTLFANSVHEFLRDTIQQLLRELEIKSRNARVVVFIDDLDRCSPQSAYRLLEALRIYLALENCVFVLGMNQSVVVDAVAANLAGGPQPSDAFNRAEAYLEKMCTNIWRLPLVADPIETLIDMLPEDVADKALKQRIREDLVVEPIAQAEPKRYPLPPNPRRLKAMANLLLRYFSLLPPQQKAMLTDPPTEGSSSLMQRLIIVAYVYQFHGELFQRWQNEPDFFLNVCRWVEGRMYSGPMREMGTPNYTAMSGVAAAILARPASVSLYEMPDYFRRLTLPGAAVTDPTAPTRQAVFLSTYPDPTAPEVFWIGRLIARLSGVLRPEDFVPLLRLAPLS